MLISFYSKFTRVLLLSCANVFVWFFIILTLQKHWKDSGSWYSTGHIHGPEGQIGHLDHQDVPWRDSSLVPRVLTKEEHELAIRLIQTVSEIFSQHDIQWVIYYGTLIGSFMCHDLLPWDDDLDALIDVKDIHKVIAMEDSGILRNAGLQYTVFRHIHKLSFMDQPLVGPWSWSWPSLDLIPYIKQGEIIQNLDPRNTKHRFSVPKGKFLPTHMRPLSMLWLPAPNNLYFMLSVTYQSSQGQMFKFTCVTAEYDHKLENFRMGRHQASCSKLIKDYPFVWRSGASNGTMTVETLRIDNKVLYNVTLKEQYYEASNSHLFL